MESVSPWGTPWDDDLEIPMCNRKGEPHAKSLFVFPLRILTGSPHWDSFSESPWGMPIGNPQRRLVSLVRSNFAGRDDRSA